MIATAGRLASTKPPIHTTYCRIYLRSKGFRFALLEACCGIEITHKTFTILKKNKNNIQLHSVYVS